MNVRTRRAFRRNSSTRNRALTLDGIEFPIGEVNTDLVKIATVVLLAAIGVRAASAASILYTESAISDGSLGGQAFTGATVIMTFAGDTTNVINSAPFFFNRVGSLMVNVSGVGTATFTDAVQVVDNQSGTLAGFGDNTIDAFILGTVDPAFLSYDLQSTSGPISNNPVVNQGAAFATDQGDLILTNVSNSTFTATFSGATPEPSTFAMLGIAALVAAAGRRRLAR